MKLKLTLDIITITYKDTIIFKSAEFNNGNETTMDDLKYITTMFEMSPEDKKIAEDGLIVYDGEINAEGYEELFRFISDVEDYSFFDVKYSTENIEV